MRHIVVALVMGCGGGGATIDASQSIDATVDDSIDAPPVDARPDAGVDAPPDVGIDAAIDAPIDAPEPDDVVFVAPSGDDSAPGTRDFPKRTINAGVATARTLVRHHVFVQTGDYAEAIAMADGVNVTGQFDASWQLDPSGTTSITAGSPVVTFDALASSTTLERVTVLGAATSTGDSARTVVITSSLGVVLRDVRIEAGDGGPGADGADGEDGAAGIAGMPGLPGVEHSTLPGCHFDPVPPGGLGASPLGFDDGGAPGVGAQDGESVGNDGFGGMFGVGDGSGFDGGHAPNGGDGVSGEGGVSLPIEFSGTQYLPVAGEDGGPAEVGANASGGGGGAGGFHGNCESSGSSGGGGGGGGDPGTPAHGGTGGGGSFGIVAIDSSFTIVGSAIITSTGGRGGAGGLGGLAGLGGEGGGRGPRGPEQGSGGIGGAGGHGGDGGFGGSGGGGAGGPSIPLMCVGTSHAVLTSSTLVPGSGGTGGTAFRPGQDGVVEQSVGCSFF